MHGEGIGVDGIPLLELEVTRIDSSEGTTEDTWRIFAGREGCGQFFTVRAGSVGIGETVRVRGCSMGVDLDAPLTLEYPRKAIPLMRKAPLKRKLRMRFRVKQWLLRQKARKLMRMLK